MKSFIILGVLASFFFGFAAFEKKVADGFKKKAIEKQEGCMRKKITYEIKQIKLLNRNVILYIPADEMEVCGHVLILYEKGRRTFKDSICHFQVIPKQD